MITEAHNPEYKKANLAGPKVIRKRAIITPGSMDVTSGQRSSMYQDDLQICFLSLMIYPSFIYF